MGGKAEELRRKRNVIAPHANVTVTTVVTVISSNVVFTMARDAWVAWWCYQ